MTKYLQADRAIHEAKLQEMIAARDADERMAGGVSGHGVPRMSLIVRLLNLGVEPEDERDGISVNRRVVFAVNKPKFRYMDRYQWYEYSDLASVLSASEEGARGLRLYGHPSSEGGRIARVARVAEIITRNGHLFEDVKFITAMGDAKGSLQVTFSRAPSKEVCRWIETVWSVTENEYLCEFFVGDEAVAI